MPFDPTEFATLALDLSQRKPAAAEVHVRTACGRAYYAAFLVARGRLEEIGHKVPKIDAHAYVRDRLSGSGDPRISGLGQNLGSLSRDRKNADYDLAPPYVSKLAFQQAFGVLTANGAQLWIQAFNAISRADLLASCPP